MPLVLAALLHILFGHTFHQTIVVTLQQCHCCTAYELSACAAGDVHGWTSSVGGISMVWTKADFRLVLPLTCGCTCMYHAVTLTLCVSVFDCFYHHTKHHISLCMFAPQQCLNQLETSITGGVFMYKPISHLPDAF